MIRIDRLALAAACASVAPAAAAQPGRDCGPVSFPLWQESVHLIATATPETVPAGPGAVQGQVVRMERAGGPDAARLPAGADRAVLVPWGCGDDFITRPWTETARWVESGVRGLFWANLRPREQWVDGLPTLDVAEPLEQPYTVDPEEWAGDPEAPLTVDEAFALMEVMPRRDAFLADPEAAVQPMLAWARAHPGPARRDPGSYVIGYLALKIRGVRLARLEPPVAGTYRFTLSVNGDAPRTFYARTWSSPRLEWDLGPPEGPDYDAMVNAPLAGYVLDVDGSASVDSLRRDPAWEAQPDGFGVLAPPDGALSVREPPERGPDGASIWRGMVALEMASQALPRDSTLARVVRADLRRWRRRAQADEPQEILARFVLGPDGSVTIEQTSRMDDGTVVVLRGERISRETIPTPARRIVGGKGAADAGGGVVDGG
ncbi:MAG TPA: hypothetical protein VEQ60_25500 [Longimicrobium sp.]|nr:hypothetical protein [Longimicrobium sp.]